MFSGIIETTAETLKILSSKSEAEELIRFQVKCPLSFDDLKKGDSIAVNGVCLTVEDFDSSFIQFTIGKETLNITGWTFDFVNKAIWNLERSLRLGDRIHGHLVTGHVDFVGVVRDLVRTFEHMEIWIDFPQDKKSYFWAKGSLCLNGVSLTINEVTDQTLRVNLIPETLKVTNLSTLEEGHKVNLEVDSFARGMIHYFKERQP